MMNRFFGWMHDLKERRGQRTGSIAIWLHEEGPERSCTLLLTPQGIQLKRPGLRTADLVLSMKPEIMDAWMEGELDPGNLPEGDFAWDGDLKLLHELGVRMSNPPMLPHQTLMRLHSQEENS